MLCHYAETIKLGIPHCVLVTKSFQVIADGIEIKTNFLGRNAGRISGNPLPSLLCHVVRNRLRKLVASDKPNDNRLRQEVAYCEVAAQELEILKQQLHAADPIGDPCETPC